MKNYSGIKGVAVYCASSTKIDPKYAELAFELGKQLALNGYTLINGGGKMGLMAACIDGIHSAAGRAIGVIPEFMVERQWNHPSLSGDNLIVTPGMHPRKATMASLATSGAIILPGGIGTLDELAEIMTWRQLDLYNAPVIILNQDGFYDPLLTMLSEMAAKGFMRTPEPLAQTVTSISEAIHALK